MSATSPHLVPLGRSDLLVSRLCLGGNVFGWSAGAAESMDVLDAFVAAGGNFIDTADVYSAWHEGNVGGESESIIGEWLVRRGRRDDLVIGTKVAKLPGHRGLSAANIVAQCDASLRRLKTDYIDVYWAHEDDESVPQEETMAAFDSLVQAGKVRYLGASQLSAARIAAALEVSRANGLASYVAVQPEYNLLRRAFEGDLRALCESAGLACVPFFGLARGFLSGKYRPGRDVVSVRAEGVRDFQTDAGYHALDVLDSIAAAHSTASQVVSPAAVALAWLAVQPTVAAPIASARTVKQLSEIAVMMSLELSDEDLRALAPLALA